MSNTKFNPNTLQPGDPVNTLAGAATFVQYKENDNGQNYRVRFRHNSKMHWYTEAQLRQANREPVPEQARTPLRPTEYDLRQML